MTFSKIPDVTKSSVDLLKERLLIQENNESKRKDFLIEKFNSEYNSWSGWFIDIYHNSTILHKIIKKK